MTDTVDTINKHEDGNTLSSSVTHRGRYWLFTWNNYTPENIDTVTQWLKRNCNKFQMQEEKGENGTPHLQGYMEFKNARSFNSLKKEFPKMHIEKARNREAAYNYCGKEETRNEIKINEKPTLDNPLQGFKLHWWQEDILNVIETKPDRRSIRWYWDPTGNTGKTSLAFYICMHKPNETLYLSGKAVDIKYGIAQFLENKNNKLQTIIFDIPRSSEQFISYEALEAVKNGIFFSGKYEGKMIQFNPPHVICFANFEPDKSKLSNDRWIITPLIPPLPPGGGILPLPTPQGARHVPAVADAEYEDNITINAEEITEFMKTL